MYKRQRIWVQEKSDDCEIGIGVKLSGLFTLQLLDQCGNTVQTKEFTNVITNGCIDKIGMGTPIENLFYKIQVGTGAVTGPNTPSITDTTLNNPIAEKISTQPFSTEYGAVTSSISGSYHWSKIYREIGYTECNGILTEVAFWSDDNIMVNRTAIRDELGIPTQIVKTPENILRVIYEYRLYLPTTDTTGSITLNSNSYNYTIRPCAIFDTLTWGGRYEEPLQFGALNRLGEWSGSFLFHESKSLLNITESNPVSGYLARKNAVYYPYVNGTKYKIASCSLATSEFNFPSGIQYIAWGNVNNTTVSPLFQMQFTPKIPKTAAVPLKLSIKIGFSNV